VHMRGCPARMRTWQRPALTHPPLDAWPDMHAHATLLARMRAALTAAPRARAAQDPKRRATADAILAHSWMRENGTASDRPLDNVILTRMRGFAGMNKLKKEALKVIAAGMSPEEIAGLHALFQARARAPRAPAARAMTACAGGRRRLAPACICAAGFEPCRSVPRRCASGRACIAPPRPSLTASAVTVFLVNRERQHRPWGASRLGPERPRSRRTRTTRH
jgi:hypothetical protein